ncbi:MAG TPA: AsmA family protein [Rhodanobacter sp.]
MSRRLRLTLLVLGGIALALLLAAVLAVYLLLQPERFTRMLQTQASAAGLELNLARPASPTLFPRPALQLDGITLSAQGARAPILLAANGRLVLPWHTVLGGPTVISQLQIDSPRVDLDALQDWLGTLPARPEGAPPNIPRIVTGVSISHGSLVRGNELLLGNVSLEVGSLITGEPFPLQLAADTAAGTAITVRLSATPRIDGSTLQLDNIALHATQGSSLTLTLGGNAHWHGPADAQASLAGKIDQADAGEYDISLVLTPASQSDPLVLALKLDGPANHADLRMPPLALIHWWGELGDPQGPQLSVPPGSGHADIARIDAGSISIEGLTIQAGDAVPAPAGTASAPPAKPGASKQP